MYQTIHVAVGATDNIYLFFIIQYRKYSEKGKCIPTKIETYTHTHQLTAVLAIKNIYINRYMHEINPLNSNQNYQ